MQTFQIAIGCDPDINPLRAWHWFLESCEYEEHPAANVESRWFKMLLRPADVAYQAFIDSRLSMANPNNPVWCLKTVKGYTFFGAL